MRLYRQPPRSVVLGVLLLAALAGGIATASESAGALQQIGSEQRPTRVVFAIDNSGSMSGLGASDPSAQRIEGVQTLIGVLSGFLSEPGEDRTVEFGALSFGSGELEVLSPLTSVLEPGLAERLRADDLGATDFESALCGAWTLAVQLVPDPASQCDLSDGFLELVGAGDQEAVDASTLVVVITDGSPAPRGPALDLDGDPSAVGCPSAATTETADGDTYLCALASTWASLRAQSPADLVVIGLDAEGEWFPDAEPYWQRIAQCGGVDERGCESRVVRSVDPNQLAELILSLFPTVDLCGAVSEDEFNCEIPGGLASVGFQVNGILDSTETAVSNESGEVYRSSAATEGFRSDRAAGIHTYRFERPVAGSWRVVSDGPQGQRIIVDYDPVQLRIDGDRWSTEDMTISASTDSPVHLPSILAQSYFFELRVDGVVVDSATSTLVHVEGTDFSATLPFPQRDSVGDLELATFLRTAQVDIEVGVAQLSFDDEEPVQPLQASPECSDFTAVWSPPPKESNRYEFGVRLDFPLLVRFREASSWTATIDSPGCQDEILATAEVLSPNCVDCVIESRGVPPIKLEVPLAGLSSGAAERRISFFSPTSQVEDSLTETALINDSALLNSEPLWNGALHMLVIGLALLGISAISARTPVTFSQGQQPAPPNQLAVPSQRHYPLELVRLGVVVFRRLPRDGEAPTRCIMLRYVVAGGLVVRADLGWRGIVGQDLTESEVRVVPWRGTV